MEQFDVIVIGSGGGLKLALPAAMKGCRVAVIESGPLGGTCLNRGCIPSKMMIYPADFMGEVRRCGEFDVLSGDVDVAFRSLMERIARQTGEISEGIVNKLSSMEGITLLRGHAVFTDPKQVQVDGRSLTAERIFIACGSRPHLPPVEGLEDVPYITSEEALKLTERPKRMIILGAGYIACELGHAYGAFGTETHFVVRSKMLRPEDAEIQQIFEKSFSKKHTVHNGVPKKVSYADGEFCLCVESANGETEEVRADTLLVATGVVPNNDRLDLSKTGVTVTAQGFVEVDEYLQTAVEGIYALGDCVGNYLFRHSVNLEGEYLFRRVFEGSDEGAVDYGPMPHAVFTDPEIAGAGMTEETAKGQQVDFVVGRSWYAESNMGMARQLDEGLVKLIIEKGTRIILGIQIIGAEASTLVQGVVPVMYMNGTLDDLLKTVYIHPALPELIRDAARDARSQL